MRRRFIAGNWKMFNVQGETRDFFNKFNVLLNDNADVIKAIIDKSIEIALFPPMLSIASAVESSGDVAISIGAQNCHFEKSGAFTGEVSAPMLADAGCTHVIIGHSERRHIFGEHDAMLNKKTISALEEGLIPVFCVGELLEEREEGKTFEVVERQTVRGLESIDAATVAEKIIIAYEPVWAIGTGKTASKEDAQEVCAFIRKLLTDKYGSGVADRVLILYGGSVKPDNTKAIMSQPDVDGVLVGGASLKPDSFYAIVKEALSEI